jgi:hypothetical protein
MKFARQLRPLKNMTKYYDIESNDLYDPILLGTESAKQAAQKTQTALNAFLKNENN